MKSNVDKLDNVPTNSSNLKSKVDKIDVNKLVHVPVDLSKLSDIVKNDVFKKEVYNSNTKILKIKSLVLLIYLLILLLMLK